MANEEYYGRVIYDTEGDDVIYAGEQSEDYITPPYTIIHLTAGSNTVYCQDAITDVHIDTAGRTDTIYHGTSILKLFLIACTDESGIKYSKVGNSLKIVYPHTEEEVTTYGTVILDSFFEKLPRNDYMVFSETATEKYQNRSISRKLTNVLINENTENVDGTAFSDTITLNSENVTLSEVFRANNLIADDVNNLEIERGSSMDTLVFATAREFTYNKVDNDLIINWEGNSITLKHAYNGNAFSHNVYKILNGDTEILLKGIEV